MTPATVSWVCVLETMPSTKEGGLMLSEVNHTQHVSTVRNNAAFRDEYELFPCAGVQVWALAAQVCLCARKESAF